MNRKSRPRTLPISQSKGRRESTVQLMKETRSFHNEPDDSIRSAAATFQLIFSRKEPNAEETANQTKIPMPWAGCNKSGISRKLHAEPNDGPLQLRAAGHQRHTRAQRQTAKPTRPFVQPVALPRGPSRSALSHCATFKSRRALNPTGKLHGTQSGAFCVPLIAASTPVSGSLIDGIIISNFLSGGQHLLNGATMESSQRGRNRHGRC